MNYSKIQLDFEIQKVEPSSLLNEAKFASMKYKAFNLMQDLDWDDANQFLASLKQKYVKISPKDQNEKQIYEGLYFWILRLDLFLFSYKTISEKRELFKKNLIYYFYFGIDIKKIIINYLDFFDDFEIIKNEINLILFEINKNEELVGGIQKFNNKGFKPSVSEWLKEYLTSAKSNSGTNLELGAFHIVKFMDTNQYVKFLSPDEKNVLKDLLDLYNWLSHPFASELKRPVVIPKNRGVSNEISRVPKEKIANSSLKDVSVSAPISEEPEVKTLSPVPPRPPVAQKIVETAKNPAINIDQKLEDLKKKVL